VREGGSGRDVVQERYPATEVFLGLRPTRFRALARTDEAGGKGRQGALANRRRAVLPPPRKLQDEANPPRHGPIGGSRRAKQRLIGRSDLEELGRRRHGDQA